MDKQKQAIAQSFSRAAIHYDTAAAVQQRAGRHLLEAMGEIVPREGINVIADIGCGTGFFIRDLVADYQPQHLIAVDIAQGMLEVARRNYQDMPHISWLCEDVDATSIADQTVDLIYSNFSFQWCDHVSHLLNELHRILKPGGFCCFTTLGPKTLVELRNAWQAVDDLDHANHFNSLSYWYEGIEQHGFSICKSYEMKDSDNFDSVIELSRSLKTIGANVVKGQQRRSLTGKQRFLAFVDEYEKYRTQKGLPVSYDIQGWLLRK